MHTHPLTHTYTAWDQSLPINVCSISIGYNVAGGRDGDDNDDNI